MFFFTSKVFNSRYMGVRPPILFIFTYFIDDDHTNNISKVEQINVAEFLCTQKTFSHLLSYLLYLNMHEK